MFKFKNYFKRVAGVALSAAVVLSTMTTFAAGNITWQVKDYVYNGTGFSIIYEQYLDGVATGYIVSGTEAGKYGLKTNADKVTRPVSWYDSTYPNYQYDEIWADGQYTGLVTPTGARLPEAAYKNCRYMWEVGGTHKEVAETRAKLGNSGDDAVDYIGGPSYPKVYTGANAKVKEENKYYGFDVFEVYEDGKARDTEVVLDKTGNCVNTNNTIKANYMTNAANENEITGSITGLVNSGSGVSSVLYKMLADNFASTYAGQRGAWDIYGDYHEVPVFDYTGYAANYFDNKLPIQHYFNLSGPVYNAYGNVAPGQEFGLSINVYKDVVDTTYSDKISKLTGAWEFDVDALRYSYYTNNIITTHATETAVSNWVYAGWELSEPYRMYEYLSIEGITFDGDIDNDGVFDTPVIFRYLTGDVRGYALANPKVEWKYAWVEASYPHEIYAQKFVEDMNGNMVATDDFRGMGKYAKENLGAEINPSSTDLKVPSGSKNYQMRLEWRDNGILYVTPYFDVNEHAGDYVELSMSPDPSYIAAYNYTAPGEAVFISPETVANRNK